MQTQVFGLKTCDTCRKVLKSLPDAQFLDVRKDGVSEHLLRAAYEKFGDALVNKKSATWRGLSEAERANDAIALLIAHPTLMKRPLIQKDAQLYLGWTPETRQGLGVAE